MCRTSRRKSQQNDFQEFWDSCAQNKTSEISTNALFRNSGTHVRRTTRRNSQKHSFSGILGLLCAEQDVGNIKTWTLRNSGAPVRRTRRRKSHHMNVLEFWDSCAQNKTSYISNNALSEFLGLLCAEQNVGNLKNRHFQEFKQPKRTPLPGAEPFWVRFPPLGTTF